MIGSTVVAGEECIFPVQSKGPDGTLDGVGVHLDASVVREQDEAVPVVKSIANGLGHFGAAGNEGHGLFDPGLGGHKPRAGRASYACAPDRGRGSVSRRQTVSARPSGSRTAGLATAPEAPRPCPPNRRAWSGRDRRPGGYRSAPAGTTDSDALLHRLGTRPPNRPDAGPVQALEQGGRLRG